LAIDDHFRPGVKVFPATEIPSYGEPVCPDEMQAGRVYFALQYSDPDLLCPHLYPLIFLGCDLDGNRRNLRFFQDFNSYRAGVRYASHGEEDSGSFHVYGTDDGKHIYAYEQALKLLMRCALIRRDAADIDQRIRHSAEESGEIESCP